MNLLTALEPGDGPTCVVGAGGKTTTMYALASRLSNAVVTSTVRIPIFDRQVSTVEVTDDPLSALDRAEQGEFPLGLVPEREGSDRYRGYDLETVDSLADAHDGPMLVKADGARMRDFKAPKDHEPRIPDSAELVVPVASVHVVGKPLTGHWVHRPKQVAALSGTELGEEITPETVAAVVANEDGGLKNVPTDARVVPLLTKVDSSEHERAARDIADAIHARADTHNCDLSQVALARFDAFEAI